MNRIDGVRMSTSLTYLAAARDRRQPHVRPDTLVDAGRIEGGRAVGVRLAGTGETIEAHRVVLAAGTLCSPSILLRSGIGAREALDRLGVPAVAELPGVGEHLVDHVWASVDVPAGRDTAAGPADTDRRSPCAAARRTPPARRTCTSFRAPRSTCRRRQPDRRAALHRGLGAEAAVARTPVAGLGRSRRRCRASTPAHLSAPGRHGAHDRGDRRRTRPAADAAAVRARSPARSWGRRPAWTTTTRRGWRPASAPTYGTYYHQAGTCRMGPDPDAATWSTRAAPCTAWRGCTSPTRRSCPTSRRRTRTCRRS